MAALVSGIDAPCAFVFKSKKNMVKMIQRGAAGAVLALAAATAWADQEDQAIAGGIADMATTAVALGQGGGALNPLGPVGALALKLATYVGIRQLPQEDQPPMFSTLSATGWGATAGNLCILAGGPPACLVVGLVTGLAVFAQSAEERTYWAECKLARQRDPSVKCAYKPKAGPAAQTGMALAPVQGPAMEPTQADIADRAGGAYQATLAHVDAGMAGPAPMAEAR